MLSLYVCNEVPMYNIDKTFLIQFIEFLKKNLPCLVIFHSWRVYRTRSKIYGGWYFKANVPSFKSDQSYLFLAKLTYLWTNFII